MYNITQEGSPITIKLHTVYKVYNEHLSGGRLHLVVWSAKQCKYLHKQPTDTPIYIKSKCPQYRTKEFLNNAFRYHIYIYIYNYIQLGEMKEKNRKVYWILYRIVFIK